MREPVDFQALAERIALETELPIGTVARILAARDRLTGDGAPERRTRPAPTAAAVIDRLRLHAGCRSGAEMAKRRGISKTTVSAWRHRDSIPWDLCVRIAAEEGVSLDWLAFGDD